MGRAYVAIARRVRECPLAYRPGDRMRIALPALEKDGSDAVCALALVDLVPAIQRIEKEADAAASGAKAAPKAGASQPAPRGVFCTGCKPIKAFVEFDLAPAESAGAAAGEAVAEDERAVATLKRFPLFAPLSERALAGLCPYLREWVLPANEVIIRRGDRGNHLYLITDGEVEVVTEDANKVEKVLGTLKGGECFGEMSLLTGDPVSATIRARTGVSLLAVEKQDFEAFLAANPSLTLYFTRLLADRLRKTSRQFIEEIEKGVLGYLHMIHPPELIQALAATDRTGTLLAKDGEREVEIYIQAGQAHAITPRGKANPDPEEAFFDFLGWRQGTFRFQPGDVPGPRTFFKDMTALLLEGLRRIDEGK